ncbi:MAG: Na+-transporting NADH:ubiquinone oxidoreductase subunit C [Myxococcota bacterium]
MSYSNTYIVGFAATVCVVCSLFVSGAAVSLKERQDTNKILDRQKNVLSVADTEKYTRDTLKGMSSDAVDQAFTDGIRARIVNLETGEYVDEVAGMDATTYDQKRALLDPELSYEAPENAAKVRRIPNHALVYQVVENDKVTTLILPVEGKGLWSTLYGFIALDEDTTTIKGLTFYQHGETPGLGGEVDNPTWKAKWPGKKAFDDQWEPAVNVAKSISRDETYQVDGLSGATLTSRGVTNLVQFWLGDEAFGLYLKNFRENGA